MLYKGVFKRVVPFFLTFAAGLFVASFFVAVTAPNFGTLRSTHRSSHKYREVHRLRMENRELRREKCRMEKEIRSLRRQSSKLDLQYAVPPVELEAPRQAPPPRIHYYRDR